MDRPKIREAPTSPSAASRGVVTTSLLIHVPEMAEAGATLSGSSGFSLLMVVGWELRDQSFTAAAAEGSRFPAAGRRSKRWPFALSHAT